VCRALQGALFAARGFAQGCGPLLFSAGFNFFTQRGPHFFPGAPMLGLAIVMLIGAIVGCSIRIPPAPAPSTGLQHADSGKEDLSCEEDRVELLQCEPGLESKFSIGDDIDTQ
jgi:hypothetical protein